MSNEFRLTIVLITVMFSSSSHAANADAAIGIDACNCNWQLKSGATTKATTVLMGVNAKIKLNSMYLGLDYYAAKPKFDDPVQLTGTLTGDRSLKFTETGITLGYYLNTEFAGYLKYKHIVLDDGPQLASTAPGFGFLGKYTFTNNWLVFANTSYYWPYLSQGENTKNTEINEVTAGTALRISLYSHVDLSYKIQKISFNRSNASNITLEVKGISLSYSYVYW